MLNCPECGKKMFKIGTVPRRHQGKFQRYRCPDCGKTIIGEKVN